MKPDELSFSLSPSLRPQYDCEKPNARVRLLRDRFLAPRNASL